MTKQNNPPAKPKAGSKSKSTRTPANLEFIAKVLGLRDGQPITPRLLRTRKERLTEAKEIWLEIFTETIQTLLIEAIQKNDGVVVDAEHIADAALLAFERRWDGVD